MGHMINDSPPEDDSSQADTDNTFHPLRRKSRHISHIIHGLDAVLIPDSPYLHQNLSWVGI